MWYLLTAARALLGMCLSGVSACGVYFTVVFGLTSPFPAEFFFIGGFMGVFIIVHEFFPEDRPGNLNLRFPR